MSDPIANAEIEDVLSSIRRLVSAEERGERPGRPGTEKREKPGARLVLTPAHRVDDTQPEDVPGAVGDTDQDHAGEDEVAGVEIDLPQPDMPPSADKFDTVEDAELVDEGGDPDEAAAVDFDHAALEEPQAGEDDDASDDGDPAWFMRHAAPDDEVPEGAAPDDVDPEQSEAPEEGVDSAAGNADDADANLAAVSDENTEEAAARADLGEIGARIAEFESVIAEQPGDWEPDGAPDDGDNAADPVSPLPWDELERDTAELGEDDAQAGPAGDAGEGSGTGGWYSEESLIDEDALRDLVGEIVRQELQGALGERITRNVRKLVRREIHRALMAQGLDD